MEPFDLVAIAPHPDDAELLCGGTLAACVDLGYRVAIVDLTRGETGTRGTVETRAAEAARAGAILGVSHRECLGLPDARLADVDEQRSVVVEMLRRLRPRCVILPYSRGRHPDHAAAAALARSACFLAGLARYGTLAPAKPRKLLHALAFRDFDERPTFVVDVTATFERKMNAIQCYASQFDGRPEGGELFPTGRNFYEGLEVKFAYYGSLIQVKYGEPFVTLEPLAVRDPVTLDVLSI